MLPLPRWCQTGGFNRSWLSGDCPGSWEAEEGALEQLLRPLGLALQVPQGLL